MFDFYKNRPKRRKTVVLSLAGDATKLAHLREYIHNALTSFQGDPADTEYQRGYEAALRELKEYDETL